MADDLQENSSKSFDLQHYLSIVRRRHLYFLIPLLIGWAIVWGVSWVLPPRYRSGTLILVEQPTMPKDYVTPNVNEDLQERLQSITQQILSRTRLLHIVEQLNLYPSNHAQQPQDSLVDRMRKDIDIELVRDAGNNRITAFNLYYSSGDPHIAQQVTSELTNMFINENLDVRKRQSEDTTKFLENQLATARTSLGAQEQKIREFKAQHVGEMPAQLASNLQILSGLQGQLQNEEDAFNAAKQQHVYLQTLADQYRAMERPAKTGDGSVVGLPAIERELEKLGAQLADLSARYTDGHPDVQKLKVQIAKTQKIRDELQASLKAKGPESKHDDKDVPISVNESSDTTQASLLAQVQSQLRSNQIELTNRENSIATLKMKIDGYQARLNEEPVREQQLADLTRGYDQSKANYDDLLKKKNESAMATSMELLQQGERFRILDPPNFPQKPEFPNRLKFCGFGLVFGLAIGVAVAAAFEMMDDRLHSGKEIKKGLGELMTVNVIAEIPVILNPSDVQSTSRRVWFGWATAALVLTAILAGSAFSYFRG
jgi:succinoglycan biosynthesis transport protein ExoP